MKKLPYMFVAFWVVASLLLLAVNDQASASDQRGNRVPDLSRTTGTPVSTLININNLSGWIRNDGWSARNPSTGNSGVTFPRGTSQPIYQDGIVWGGNVNDGGSQILRVGGQTYNIGTVGGRIISKGVAADPGDPDVRIYRVRRDYKTADLRQDAAELNAKAPSSVTQGEIDAVRAQYERDWMEWPASQGAPYYDKDSNSVYDPTVDEPGVADADQVIWFVCNDLNSGKTNALYGSNPIGMELQVTLWGYNRTDPLANVYFKKFTFIYKGTATSTPNSMINDMYVCQWSDPDLGDSGNDFAGCDTTLSLVYAYNGEANDNSYAVFGLKPPAAGYDFFQGPIIYTGNMADTAIFGLKKVSGAKNLPMTAAFYFAAGGTYSDPPFSRDGTIQWYNLLRGLTPITGDNFVYGGAYPNPTKFWLDGDPVAGTGRIDGIIDSPGDRRIGADSGPFSMALGDTQEVVVAVVAGIGADYLNSVAVMKINDAAAQNAYNTLFNLPKPPPNPVVKAVALDNQVILDWGFRPGAVDTTENYLLPGGADPQGYSFEGYNVYQLPNSSAGLEQATKIATFDVVNGVRTIYDQVFDPALGITVTVIKQKGTDSGIRHVLEIKTDQLRQQPIVNGNPYYFAVTAYGYTPDPIALTHALEGSVQGLTVIPQTTDPGVRYSSSYGDTIAVSHSSGSSDGTVEVTVVDPSKTTGHDYQVTFQTDTVTGGYKWGITDVTTSTVVLADQTNQAGDDAYVTVDGLLVKAAGPPLLGKSYSYASADPVNLSPVAVAADPTYAGGRWFTGGSHGGDLFFGGVFLEPGFWGATTVTASEYEVVQIRFRPMASYTDLNGNGHYDIGEPYVVDDPSQTQKAFMYQTFAGSAYEGFFDLPFTAWDVTDPANPRQINVVVRDRDQNHQWDLHHVADPPDPALPNNGDQQFNYTWFLRTSYDPTGTMYGDGTGGSLDFFDGPGGAVYDAMWAMWIDDRGNGGMLAEECAFTLTPNFVNTDADVFSFTAPAATTYDASAAKADASQINVFPNPYYGFNRLETSPHVRFVRFNHVPPKAEFRIFNLAGVLVRGFGKDDPSQYVDWDLNNQNGLPVASGIYIVYINMPEIGATKTLKVIVIREQQYLDNF